MKHQRQYLLIVAVVAFAALTLLALLQRAGAILVGIADALPDVGG